MGFMREKLQDALEDQKAIRFDRKNGVLLTWNGSQTFQAFDLSGECLAIWMRDGEVTPDNPMGAVSERDALALMDHFVQQQFIEEEEYQDGERVSVKRHYLAVYANDQETYLKYGGGE